MAIAFEFDFRSTPAGAAEDTGKRAAPGKEQGEAFAALLSRARSVESADADETPPPSLIGPVSLLAPLVPEAEAGLDETILLPAAPAAEAPEAEIPGELELDREISLARAAETQLGRPEDTATAPPARLHAVLQAAPDTAVQASGIAPDPPGQAEVATLPAPTAGANAAETASLRTSDTPAMLSPMASPGITPAASAATTAALTTSPAPASNPPAATDARRDMQEIRANAAADAPGELAADLHIADEIRPDRFTTTPAAEGGKPAQADSAITTQQTVAPVAMAASVSSPAPAGPAAPALAAMAPAHALVIASPAQVVDIVAQTARDGQSDRVVVQLDPPELGRVSIDFKFDAQGLQHVTITSETPEAMRQLRAMHFELVQALERQGLDGQNMTFQHQQQNSQQAANAALLKQLQSGPAAAALTGAPAVPAAIASGPITADGRLDIRL